MARNRVIYQSQALFIAPNSTGIQVSGFGIANPQSIVYTTGALASGLSLLYKLDRVQNCNFNFTINRQDINELGQLARIDSIVNDTPTVGLDFSYYVTDGLNERLMGFNFSGRSSAADLQCVSNSSAISGLMVDTQGNNYYILTVEEGEDVVGANLASGSNTNSSSVIGIGNGFITEYSLDASVGSIPTASVTVEGFNIKSDVNRVSNLDNLTSVLTGSSPAIDYSQTPATRLTGTNRSYAINAGNLTTGVSTISALRPGDIVLTMPVNDGFTELDDAGNKAHVQSFAFTIPLTRTVLQRLGNVFGFARVLEVPLNMDITISAIVNELQEADIFDQLCGSAGKKDFTVTLNQCADVGDAITPKLVYNIRGAILNSESFSTDIGGNQTVDLTYNVQIGGANDTGNGVFMSGSYTTGNAMTLLMLTGFYKLGTAKNY
jgi:hypothetical protein